MANPKVLSYAPYHEWGLHGLWELTLLHGVRLRGATTGLVMCDGLYSDCDLHHDVTCPRNDLSCTNCQTSAAILARSMGTPFRWLGRFLGLAETTKARRWADALEPEQFHEARYGDWEIGLWVLPSVHSHLRASKLDFTKPRVCEVYRSYLYSGLVACFGLSALLDHEEPDILLLFNGRFSSTRCAFELARERGIRVVCHERGCRMETIRLFDNEICMSVAPAHRLWDDWGDTPLSGEELTVIHELMIDRAKGNQHGWEAFSPPPQEVEALRQQLQLDPGRPTWVVYTSSDDETCTQPDRIGAFPDHGEWLTRTIEWARKHPEMDMVVRCHPNTGSKTSTGVNAGQLEFLKQLRGRVAPNVRMVMPDDEVSSYTLMEIATVGLMHGSTTSLEMACRGKQVLMGGAGWCSGLPFVRTVREKDEYDGMLDKLLATPGSGYFPRIREQAYRFAYAIYYRWQIPFPLVEMPNPHLGKLRYTKLDALQPGQDPHLDRMCRIILDHEPPVLPPTPEQQTAHVEQERAWWRNHHDHVDPTQPEVPEATIVNIVAHGEKLFAEGDVDAAVRCFEAAIARDPQDVDAHNNLGVIQWQQGHTAAALGHLATALELAPSNRVTVMNVAEMFTTLQCYDEAKKTLGGYVAMAPTDSEANGMLRDLWNRYPLAQQH